MAACSSILVNRMNKEFEGDVVKYSGGDSITAGDDNVWVWVWHVFPLPDYKEVKEALHRP
jgi:hypothetical protein